jgi:hypothetical protein
MQTRDLATFGTHAPVYAIHRRPSQFVVEPKYIQEGNVWEMVDCHQGYTAVSSHRRCLHRRQYIRRGLWK